MKKLLGMLVIFAALLTFSACSDGVAEPSRGASGEADIQNTASGEGDPDSDTEGANDADSEAGSEQATAIFDRMMSADKVMLSSGYNFIFITASDEQAAEIFALLSAADKTKLIESDADLTAPRGEGGVIDVLRSPVMTSYIFQDSEGYLPVTFAYFFSEDEEIPSTVYLQFTDKFINIEDYDTGTEEGAAELQKGLEAMTTLTFELSDNQIDIRRLTDMRTKIRVDRLDPDNCALIRPLDGSGLEYYVNKDTTARLRYYLNNSLRDSEVYSGDNDYVFNIELKFGDDLYSIDTIKGVFSIDGNLYQIKIDYLDSLQMFTNTGEWAENFSAAACVELRANPYVTASGTETISCALINASSKPFQYGEQFHLEYMAADGWAEVNETGFSLNFELGLHTLPPFSRLYIDFPVSAFSSLAEPGHYRIALEHITDGEAVYTVYASFEVSAKN